MPETFIKIASVTVGSGGASSIDFTAIPSTYTDLCLKMSIRGSVGAVVDDLVFQFNGNATSYSAKIVQGSGSAASSANSGYTTLGYLGANEANSSTASTFGNLEMYIPNYAGSNNKSYSADTVSENNATAAYATLVAGLWAQTSAINRINLFYASGNFAQYSTATLYGIKNS